MVYVKTVTLMFRLKGSMNMSRYIDNYKKVIITSGEVENGDKLACIALRLKDPGNTIIDSINRISTYYSNMIKEFNKEFPGEEYYIIPVVVGKNFVERGKF